MYGVSAGSEVLNVVVTFFLLPESQVLLEKFNDALGVSEGLFVDIIDLVHCLLKSGLSEVAGLLVVLHDLIVEHREVKSETKLDGVASWEVFASGICLLVVLESAISSLSKKVCLCTLSHVSVVVTDHLKEECLALSVLKGFHSVILDHVDDVLAVLLELPLDLLLVCLKGVAELRVLRVLLNSSDSSNSSSLAANKVFKSNREQIPLFDREVATLLLENWSKEVNHVVESLSLLSHSGHKDLLLHRYLSIQN